MDISAVEIWLDKKETYQVRFKQAKKKCFISIDKFHLVTILKLSSPGKMFKTLDKKYFATNSTCLCQLFRNCQTISIQKNIVIVEKYEAMLNFNAEIYIQKPKLAF